MSQRSFRKDIFRQGDDGAQVTPVELFFDLVFVFAITQLSHTLLKDLTLAGAFRTGFLFLAVWWVWIFTSWVMNWLDPERLPVRIALFALMLSGLVLSTSIPQAMDARALPFALAYVFAQVGRSLFMLWAIGDSSANNRRNFTRITIWLAISGIFWIAGALTEPAYRPFLWITALAIELVGPSLGFYVPGMGRSKTQDWDVRGDHMAERCSLFIIIALGESLLVTGVTFAATAWNAETAAAFCVAFLGTVTMWWIYFDTGAERGSRKISESDDPGRLARLAYTYMHIPIVAGIIVSAVGDELVLAHPGGETDLKTAIVLIGGPLLFLIGNLLFKSTIASRLPLSHLVGLGLLAVLALAYTALSPLWLAGSTVAALAIVAAWETLSLRHGKELPAEV